MLICWEWPAGLLNSVRSQAIRCIWSKHRDVCHDWETINPGYDTRSGHGFGVEDTDEDSDSSDETNNLGEGMDGGTGNEF